MMTFNLKDIHGETPPTDNHGYDHYFQKVLPTFSIMLLITALTTGYLIETGLHRFVAGFGLAGYIFLLGLQVTVFYGAELFRKYYPFNIAFAIILAIVEGAFIAPIIASFLSAGLATLIGQALGLTALIFIIMTGVQMTTRIDFSFLGTFLIIMVLGLISISILSFFVGFPGWFSILISVVTLIVFTLFILYDMTKIMKKEYGAVAGAIALYIDFIIIFIELLQLLAVWNTD